jgi:hypothetical protein
VRENEGAGGCRFVQLGEYLCEARAKQYWRLEKLTSFDEFLEKRLVDSRRKVYYLMAIHWSRAGSSFPGERRGHLAI